MRSKSVSSDVGVCPLSVCVNHREVKHKDQQDHLLPLSSPSAPSLSYTD